MYIYYSLFFFWSMKIGSSVNVDIFPKHLLTNEFYQELSDANTIS